MNIDVPLADGRRIEVLANGLLLWQGAQAPVPGTALEQAAKRKRLHAYPEFAVARRCKLLVLALGVRGRFGPEAMAFSGQSAKARAREYPARLHLAQRVSLHPWTGC